MPLPLSPNSGLGMNVAVLPCCRGDVLDDVLVPHAAGRPSSASVSYFMSISPWPAVATSWWCVSTSMPTDCIVMHHLRAQVGERVGRATPGSSRPCSRGLWPRLPPPSARPVFQRALDRVDLVERVVRAPLEADESKMKNSASGPKYAVSAMPVDLQVGARALARGSRGSAAVGLARDRIDDVADQRQRRRLEERIHHRGRRIRHHQHVGRVDRAASRGSTSRRSRSPPRGPPRGARSG